MPAFEDLWSPIRLTLALASITTFLLLMVGTPIAWWLARSKAPWKEAVATVLALPLVLPPTVLGFYLLLALGPNGPGGWIGGLFGLRTLAFTFEALVIGSVLYSMPFVVQPIRNAFEAFGDRPLEVAATLRASFLAGGAATLDSATLTGVGPVATQDQIFVLGREGVCKPLAGRTNVSVLRCHVAEVLLAEAPCRL